MTKCTSAFQPCATSAEAAERCACYDTYYSCTKNVKVCVETVATSTPVTALAIDFCVDRTPKCSLQQCLRFASPSGNVTDSDYAEYCKSRACGSEHIKGGKDQFCFCVRDHFKCLDGHFGSLADKCDATNALEGTYADLCPDLCAALPRITPRPQVVASGVAAEGVRLNVMPTLQLSIVFFAASVIGDR